MTPRGRNAVATQETAAEQVREGMKTGRLATPRRRTGTGWWTSGVVTNRRVGRGNDSPTHTNPTHIKETASMQRRRCRSARADALLPLALFALLVGQVQLAEAQRPPSNAGDAPVVPRSSAIQGRDAGAAQGGDQDPRLLIAHGLEMAIEGSMLQGLAMQPGLAAGANVSPAAAAPRPGAAGTPGVNSSGLGFTGAPGETVSGRPVTTPATGTGVQTLGSTGTGPTRKKKNKQIK